MSEEVSKIEEAKSLGIKRPDLMREDTLDEKIKAAKELIGVDEAGTKTEEVTQEVVEDVAVAVAQEEKSDARPIAPAMNLTLITTDDRTKLLAELEAEDPECKYVFKRASVSDHELSSIGLQRTGRRLKNDIVCRTRKDSFKQWQKDQNVEEYKSMKSIDGGTGKVKYHNAAARTPPELEEEMLMEED